jgi:transcription elongation factor Elf1
MLARKMADTMAELVEALPEELTCSICTKPHMVNCCEQSYCKGCKWQLKKNTCPHCHSTQFSSILLQKRLES